MRLIGLLVVRNESWILGCSMRAALNWVDELVVVDHNSTDGTREIINEITAEHPWRVHFSHWQPTEKKTLTSRYPDPDGKFASWEADVPIEDESRWDEMDVRQHALLLGRKHGGTHFAMIDADEILTANLIDRVRQDVIKLMPGEVLDYPLYAMRTLDEYQDDDTHWSRGWMSTAFCDAPHLSWRAAGDNYHFHSRVPQGSGKRVTTIQWKQGGVFHLQWANRRRIVSKHVHYEMTEHIRWPGRNTPEQLNTKYSDALRAPKNLSIVPPEWWGAYPRHLIETEGWPWFEGEIRRMIEKHGREKFAGLDLKGF